MSVIRSGKFLLCGVSAVLALAGCDSAIIGPQDALERAALAHASHGAPSKGDILIIGGGAGTATKGKSTVAAEFYDLATKKFAATGALATSRAGITAVVFDSGKFSGETLVEGGLSGTYSVTSHGNVSVGGGEAPNGEIYNPKTGKFTSTGKTSSPRAFQTATLLKDGTVLVTGGFDPFGNPVASAELFNPRTGKFTALENNMSMARAVHTATLLGDGTVLLVGGIVDDNGSTTGTAEIYDPTDETFTAIGSVPGDIALAGQTATLIEGCKCGADGKVLIAGGFDGVFSTESTTTTVLLYDPTDQTFTMTKGQLTVDRTGHTATLLSDGKVLFAGGTQGQLEFSEANFFGIFGGILDSAEIFDPSNSKMTCVGGKAGKGCASTMVNSRVGHTAALISTGSASGEVLLAGGAGATTATKRGQGAPLATAELYNPSTGKFTATGSMTTAHVFGTAATIP